VASADALLAVSEDESLRNGLVLLELQNEGLTYGQDVDHTHDHAQDTRRNHNPPECQSERLLAHCVYVQVAQRGYPQDHHDARECDEARIFAE